LRRDTLRVVPAYAGIGVVSIGAGALTASTFTGAHLWMPLTLLAVMCLGSAAFSLAVEKDPFSPPIIVGSVFSILYLARPLYILSLGHWGPTRALDDRPVTSLTMVVMSRTSWYVLLSFFAWTVGYGLCRFFATSPQAAGQWRGIRDSVSGGAERLRVRAAVRLVIVTGALAAFAYWHLIRQAGGLGPYVHALSARSGFFYGRAYFVAVTLPLKVVTLIVLALLFTRGSLTRKQVVLTTGLVIAVSVGDLLTGGRAGLLLGTLLPVVLLRHYLQRPLRLGLVLPLVAVALVAFVGVRAVTRDSVIEHDSRTTALSDALRSLPRTTVGGREAIEYDSLMTLVGDPSPHFQEGRTYLAILTFPIPRALWHGKPAGGGDTWFTETYFPDYYNAGGHTETSVSFIGESYANFGPAGIVVASLILGMFVAALYARLLRARTPRNVLLYSVLIGYVVTLFRGDAFHSVTWSVMTVALLFVLWPRLAGRVQTADDARWGLEGARPRHGLTLPTSS
jgi:oligosaccharide repeat unit polymerase